MSTGKNIESLTQAQKDRFGEFVEKWTAIGLSTDPANRDLAEEGIRECYQIAGLEAPSKIVWCESPMSMILTKLTLEKSKEAKFKKASVWASVWASVRASVRDSVWDSVMDSVMASVRASVWDSVMASVWDSVMASVWDSVRDSVWDSVWDSVRASVWDCGYGSHDANWLAFYDFFMDVCDLESPKKLSGLMKVAQNAGWFMPYKDICFISERHNIVSKDEQGRMHSLTGPAIAYPDGWSIYQVHGVRVPEFVVMQPETITIELIEKAENAEIRRVMVEQYGQDRYIKDSVAIKVHSDDWGILWRKPMIDDEEMWMVEVINDTEEPDGSRNVYFIRVHPEIRPMTMRGGQVILGSPQEPTALNAIASTFGKTGYEYSEGLALGMES